MIALNAAQPAAPATGATTVVRRGLASAAAAALLIVFVPRTAALHDHGLVSSLAVAALFVTGALSCALGRVWSGAMATLAAVALALVFVGRPAAAGLTESALGVAAMPLLGALLAASVASRRWLAVIAIGFGVVAGPLHALLYDPYLDPQCMSNCAHSPLAVTHTPTWAAFAEHVGTWASAIVITLLVVAGGRRVALLAGAVAGMSFLSGLHPNVLLLGAAIVAATLAADIVTSMSVGVRLRELMSALAAGPDLQGTLRTALADVELTIAYVVDGATEHNSPHRSAEFVDVLVARDGTPCPPPPPAQVSTPVRADGNVLAWIRHGPAAADVARLAATLKGPARLAFAVERLEALTGAQSRHIAASRTRIVESGDEERRRLERDIHDGAQQQMLSLGMQIEMALIDLEPGVASRPVLEVSLARVRDALGELRGIAHGLRPFPLEVAGIDTALHALARRSVTPVIVGPVPRRRLGSEVESTVLALVQSAVACADGPVDVEVTEHDSTIELSISGLSPSVINGLFADRVASVGGSLRSGSNEVTAVIPCAP